MIRAQQPKTDSVFSRLVRRSEFYSFGLLLVTAASFLLAIFATSPGKFLSAVDNVGVIQALAVAGLAFSNYILRFVRFDFFMRRKALRVPAWQLLKIYFAGFSMTATPGKIGEFIRMWLLRRGHQVPYRKSLPVAVADRADDLFAAATLCALSAAAFLSYVLPTVIVVTVTILVGVMLGRAAILRALIGGTYKRVRRWPRMFARLRQLANSVSELFRPFPLLVGLVLGCTGWLLEGLGFYLCASIFAHITVPQAIFIFTFSNLVGALTFLPGGVGGTEVTMVTLLTTLHLQFDQATAVALVVRVGTLWFGIGCGYIALFACRQSAAS